MSASITHDPFVGPPTPPEDRQETVNEFMGRVAQAQFAGEESIEASDAIINYFNRKGLNGGKYFIYQDIKIYPLGKTEEIEAEEEQSLLVKLHGADGGTPVKIG